MIPTLEYLLYFTSIVSLTFWIVIWAMHVCAITNAKLKLNRRSYTSAASKRKRKLKHLGEKYLIPNKNRSACKNNKSLCVSQQIPPGHIDPNLLESKHNNNNKHTFQTYCSCKQYSLPPSNTLTSDINDESGTHLVNNFDHYINLYSINLPLPGVSIIKPLVGIDTNLYKNLETFFQMDYPIYELLFCVQDINDSAILIVTNLLKAYPDVDARLFTGGARVGVNPKINNMQPAYEAIKYELVLISDSGISMKRDTLLDMVSHMHDNVALVHQMPFVCDGRKGFQSIVEKVYFGTAHARAYLTADLLSINCPTGMSALMRKHLLDEVGGIKAFGQYLAEDFFFAKSFTDRGWKISISSQPAWQNSASSSDTLSTLNSRIERWIKLRFAMVPQWTLLEPFSECMLLGLLGAMSISFLWAIDPFAIFLFHVLIWFLCDYKLLCIVQNGPLTFSKTDFIVAWLIRECTALIIFFKALANPKVTWRSRIFKLKWGGYAEEIFSEKEGPNETRPQHTANESNLRCAFNLYYVTPPAPKADTQYK